MNWNLKLKNLSTQQSKNETALGLDEVKNTKGGDSPFYQPGEGINLITPSSPSFRDLGADAYLPGLGFYSFAGFTPGSL